MSNITLIILFVFLSIPNDSSIVNLNLHLPDTINVKNVPIKDNRKNSKNEYAPWIVALLIGFVSAGVNIYIVKVQTRKQELIFQRNVKETKKLALETLQNNQNFESNQSWRSLLRIKLSSLVSSGNKLAIKLRNNEVDSEIVDNLFIEFEFSKIEIKLLLNNKISIQETLDNSIDEFYICVVKNSDNNVLTDTLKHGENLSSLALEILNT